MEGKDSCAIPPQKGYTRLPSLFAGLSLAFHPWISPHYKVVGIRRSERKMDHFQIEIYSSETRRWRLSGDPFSEDDVRLCFDNGIYLNGCVHWLSYSPKSLYLNVREVRIMQMPMPQIDGFNKSYRYVGESGGHLHPIVASTFNPKPPQFDVFEMERDRSGWFLKFRVNLSAITTAFPRMLVKAPFGLNEYRFSTLCVIRSKLDEESYLVGLLTKPVNPPKPSGPALPRLFEGVHVINRLF